MTRPPVIAVVGAGIAGLAAAWELVAGPDRPADDDAPIVHVLDAGHRVGGKLTSAEFAGRRVDTAADAFLGRRPEATGLCTELGLDDELVPVGATGASILARGGLRRMPDGLQLGVPTRWWPLARSGLLGPIESLRVAKDLVDPHRPDPHRPDPHRPDPHRPDRWEAGDRSVADIVGERLGRPVVDRLVDPLIGGINAGGVDELSAAATFPALLAASTQTGSLMRCLGRTGRPAPSPAGTASPVFWSLRQGTASLVDALVDRLSDPASPWRVCLHAGVSVTAIHRVSGPDAASGPWSLTLRRTPSPSDPAGDPDQTLVVDGMILAVPAPNAAVLLADHAPEAATLLRSIEYASVSVITLEFPAQAIGKPLLGTGFLVPRTSPIGGRPALMTGCTYLSRKWPHLAHTGRELMRVSVGRHGDERHAQLDDGELTEAARDELTRVLDIRDDPSDTMVTRWEGAFPQYRVGHLVRVTGIDAAVSALPGIALAGAAYRGVGIPACIGSGREAARTVRRSLGGFR